MLIATILDILRTEYKLSSTTYDDTLLTRLINKAVKKISEYYPEVELSYTPSIAGQTRYTITKDHLIKLKHVYYCQESFDTNPFKDTDIKVSMPSNMSTFYPSQNMEFIQRLEMIRKMNPMDAEIVATNKFDLIPTPTSVSNVYYEYERYRTIEELPDMFEEDLINLVFFYIGDKSFKEASYTQNGNKYNFDRRGNITVEKETVDAVRQRQSAYDSIIKSIKTKVMKL